MMMGPPTCYEQRRVKLDNIQDLVRPVCFVALDNGLDVLRLGQCSLHDHFTVTYCAT